MSHSILPLTKFCFLEGPQLSQIAPASEDQIFKHGSLWETFHIQTIILRKFKWSYQGLSVFWRVTTLLTTKCDPLDFSGAGSCFASLSLHTFWSVTVMFTLVVILSCSSHLWAIICSCHSLSAVLSHKPSLLLLMCVFFTGHTLFFVSPIEHHLSPWLLGSLIALGKPLGCDGAFTMLNKMKSHGTWAYGVLSMCTGTGVGAAAVF